MKKGDRRAQGRVWGNEGREEVGLGTPFHPQQAAWLLHRSASSAVASSSRLPGKQASCPRPGPAVCILVSPQACACPVSHAAFQPRGGKKSLSLCLCAIPGRTCLPRIPSSHLAFSVCHVITFQNGHAVLEKHFHPTPAASDLCLLGSKTGYTISLRWASSCSFHSQSHLNLL